MVFPSVPMFFWGVGIVHPDWLWLSEGSFRSSVIPSMAQTSGYFWFAHCLASAASAIQSNLQGIYASAPGVTSALSFFLLLAFLLD